VNNNNIAISYTYDLAGNERNRNLNGNNYPSTYASAGRLLTFSSINFNDATNPPNLLTNPQYNALGQLTLASFANGLSESWSYDKRGRLQSAAVGTNCGNGTGTCSGSTVYGFSLSFAPDGDLLASNDSVNLNWVYKYDDFNRLVCSNLATNGSCQSPSNGTPTYSYVYDRFSNRWNQNGPNSFVATFTGNKPGSPANNNQMDGYSYDLAGNMTLRRRASLHL
jgi:YD repeat-containing protein